MKYKSWDTATKIVIDFYRKIDKIGNHWLLNASMDYYESNAGIDGVMDRIYKLIAEIKKTKRLIIERKAGIDDDCNNETFSIESYEIHILHLRAIICQYARGMDESIWNFYEKGYEYDRCCDFSILDDPITDSSQIFDAQVDNAYRNLTQNFCNSHNDRFGDR